MDFVTNLLRRRLGRRSEGVSTVLLTLLQCHTLSPASNIWLWRHSPFAFKKRYRPELTRPGEGDRMYGRKARTIFRENTERPEPASDSRLSFLTMRKDVPAWGACDIHMQASSAACCSVSLHMNLAEAQEPPPSHFPRKKLSDINTCNTLHIELAPKSCSSRFLGDCAHASHGTPRNGMFLPRGRSQCTP